MRHTLPAFAVVHKAVALAVALRAGWTGVRAGAGDLRCLHLLLPCVSRNQGPWDGCREGRCMQGCSEGRPCSWRVLTRSTRVAQAIGAQWASSLGCTTTNSNAHHCNVTAVGCTAKAAAAGPAAGAAAGGHLPGGCHLKLQAVTIAAAAAAAFAVTEPPDKHAAIARLACQPVVWQEALQCKRV